MIKWVVVAGIIHGKVGEQWIGTLERKEDGYYDWYPDLRPGYIPSYVLHAIADKLDILNEEWDEEVRRDAG